MSRYVGEALAGLGGGAVVALLGLGLVLTHRASGVINLAHASVGAYLALAYYRFRDDGTLVLPILGLPARVHLLPSPTQATALVVLVVLAAAVGVVLHLLVFRPLRAAPPLARMVGSLGVFLYTQELVRLRFGGRSAATTRRYPVLPQTSVRVLGSQVGVDRLWLAAGAVAAAGLLTFAATRTRFGLLTRAAAANDEGALLMGLRPDRAAAANWVLATVLGGVAVVLVEPIAGLDPTSTGLLIVPALAASLLGGLSSYWLTAAAGLAIGAVQAVVLGYLVEPDTTWVPNWLPVNGVVQAVPVVLILVALAWRGDVVPGRGAVVLRRPLPSPTPRWPAIPVVVVGALGALGALVLGASGRQALVASLTGTVLALSVVVVTGCAGLISLAPLALAGVGGFVLVHAADGGLPAPLDLLAAALAGGVAGLIIAASVSRVRGTTFAVATLALSVAIEQLVLASPSVSGGTGGTATPRPSLLGWDLGRSAQGAVRPAFVMVVLVVALVALGAVINLRRGITGLRWLAVRSNERAAAATGVDVARAKLTASAVAGALAGLAGALTAWSTPTLSPASFTVVGSLVIVALTFLGGISSPWGALVAGLLVQGGLIATLTSSSSTADEHAFAVSGIALIVAASLAPEGVAGRARWLVDRLRGVRV